MIGVDGQFSITYAAFPEGDWRPFLVARESSPAGLAKPRLLDRVRGAVRARHYSRRTEEAYVAWIKRYIFFHDAPLPILLTPGDTSDPQLVVSKRRLPRPRGCSPTGIDCEISLRFGEYADQPIPQPTLSSAAASKESGEATMRRRDHGSRRDP